MVSTMAEFIEKISELYKKYSKEGEIEYELFYRGVNVKHDNPHIPSIYYPNTKYIDNEHIIFNEIIAQFPNEMAAQRTTIEKLIWMRHYGIPTRLLDISSNPLIALFFASFDEAGGKTDKEDGVIYAYRFPKKEIRFCDSDLTAIVANLCKRKFSFKETFEHSEYLDDFKNDLNMDLLCYEIGKDNIGFEKYITKRDIRSVVCLRPYQNNPRIIRQSGNFFLFGIKDDEKNKPAKLDDDFILDPITISHTYKKLFLEELKALSINESFVYPEYEHFAKVIAQKYK
jgi:hypothetical protein